MDRRMETRRVRFIAALVFYMVWLGALGLLALNSAQPPPTPASIGVIVPR